MKGIPSPFPVAALLALINPVEHKYTGLAGDNGEVKLVADYDPEDLSLKLKYSCGSRNGYMNLRGVGTFGDEDFDSSSDSDGEEASETPDKWKSAEIEFAPVDVEQNEADLIAPFEGTCGRQFGPFPGVTELVRGFAESEKKMQMNFLGKPIVLMRGETFVGS